MAAEHTFNGSARLKLTHAAVMSTQLDRAIEFYCDVIGLSLGRVEADPIRKGRRRALLIDGDGSEMLEIIEMAELAHPSIPGRGGIHHIGFQLPQSEWHRLRARMDAKSYPYEEIGGRIFVRDFDGLVLEIERA